MKSIIGQIELLIKPLTNENSFKFIQIHSNSFKFIQIHSKITIFSILLFSFLTLACQEETISPTSPVQSFDQSVGGEEIKLGAKINNPYSLKNMQLAYNEINNERGLKSATEVELKPTHLYVRFLPKDSAEYEALLADTTLTLFGYPLDYELSQGDYYHDATLPANQITWQYTKVPTNYVFSAVQHEIIEEVYIPAETADTAQLKSANINWDILLNKSMQLTGNIKTDTISDATNLKGWFTKALGLPDLYNPTATIRVWDDVMATNIPIFKVPVTARHLLNWQTKETDNNGYARFKEFRYSVNFSIKWEQGSFDIRNGWYGQAVFNGPCQKSPWDLNIVSGKSIQFATIFRAAMRSFYMDNLGIHRPQTGAPTAICYIDDKGTGDYWGNLTMFVLPDIRIYGYDPYDGSFKNPSLIYRTTIHELGHQSHCQSNGTKFLLSTKYIRESWADCVEWALTNQEYKERGVMPIYSTANTSNSRFYEVNTKLMKQYSWPTSGDISYSPIFIDLIDNINQFYAYNDGIKRPNDAVTGYTLETLSEIVQVSYGLKSLKENLKKNKPTGVTDEKLDLLFKRYEEVLEQ